MRSTVSRRFFVLSFAVTAILLPAPLFAADPPAAAGPPDNQRVPVIKEIKYEAEDHTKLKIEVHGEVPTGGWKEPRLIQRIYVRPPADGIWEYDFFAVKPGGIVTQAITPISAKDVWENPPRSLKGIRVYGVGEGVKEVEIKWPK